MERLTNRNNVTAYVNCDNCNQKGSCNIPQSCLEALANRLAIYEDAEEQGRLIVLPCCVGDKVYLLWPCGKNGKSVSEMVVAHIDIDFLPEIEFSCRKEKSCGNYWFFKADSIGKTVFLSHEEAEEALKGAKTDG